ncbi:MAG: hypothetical protein K2N95_18730 [Lachnospiraceae bacterium]|nr:hypothetical protein [Lachnospiraceae bacterium]
MDLIRKIREDSDLSDLLIDVCDVEIFSEFKVPEDEFGHVTYNISGKTFAREANGSEFILLEDGSVGYWGSEGRCGRIADDLKSFFALMVNCPYWTDYLWEDAYEDEEELREFAEEIFEEHADNAMECEFDLAEAQQELADRLGIEKKTDAVGILMQFYHSAKREPRFLFTYTEDDGSTHSGTGSVFDG